MHTSCGLRPLGAREPARRRPWRSGLFGTVALLAAACGTRLPPEAFTTTSTSQVRSNGSSTSPPTTISRASDIGVTDTSIRIGILVSRTSPLGAETFSGPMYGVQALIASVNAGGGIAGRTIDAVVCDDGASGAGNRRCATKLVEDDKVFALVGTSVLDYAAAAYVNDHGVPDVGGQPVGNEYEQYPHLWSVYGSSSPRHGKSVGFGGTLYGGTEVYRYFAVTLGARVAGVVAYNQADSLRFADLTADALGVESYRVVREQVDFAMPNWQAAAIDMESRGVDIVFDALDSAGNVRLCQAMDATGLVVKAKAVTVQSWNETPRIEFGSAATCRNEMYATATSRNYMDTAHPAVAAFRADMAAAFPDREMKLSMWELEGWGGARWFVDAAQSCGDALTRTCVEDYLRRPVDFDAGGLFTPRSFVVSTAPGTPGPSCLFVAQWQDGEYGGKGGWVSRTPGGDAVCYDVPSIPYHA